MSKLDLTAVKKRIHAFETKGTSSNIFWKPEEGTQIVRLVPYLERPEWPFIELKFYYKLGGKTYLAPTSLGKPDPIQAYVDKLKATYDKDQYRRAKLIEAKPRTYAPVIIRGREKEGVKFWGFGVRVFNSILKIMDDVDYGDIVDVENGHDLSVEFKSSQTLGTEFPETTILAKPRKTVAVPDELKYILHEQVSLMDTWEVPTVEVLLSAMDDYIQQQTGIDQNVTNEEPVESNTSPSAEMSEKNTTKSTNEFEEFFAQAATENVSK